MAISDSFQNLPGSRTPKTRHCRGVYRLCLLSLGVIIIYCLFLVTICGATGPTGCDLVNRKLIDSDVLGRFGGWSLTHVILYYFIGLLFPDCMLLAMTIGVIWEIFENLLGSLLPHNSVNITTSSNLQYQNGWLEGTLQDVLCNFVGFVAGMLTTKYFLNGNPPKLPWVSDE